MRRQSRPTSRLARTGVIVAFAVIGLLVVGPANGDGVQPPAGSKGVPAHPDPVGTQPPRGSHVSTVDHGAGFTVAQPAAR